MATMNRSDFIDRLQQARDALGMIKFQTIPETHDFPPGVYLWPMLEMIEEAARQINDLKRKAVTDQWQ